MKAIKSRLEAAIKILEDKGYNITSVTKIPNTYNSDIYKCNLPGNSFSLKFYRIPDSTDPRNRSARDIQYLEYCKKNSIKKVPRLIMKSNRDHWSACEWVSGSKVTEINNEFTNQIINFLIMTNRYENNIEMSNFPKASDALISIKDLTHNIYSRINIIFEKQPTNEIEYEVAEWITNELIITGTNIISRVLNDRSSYNIFSTIYTNPILSQSDVGIHNMINYQGSLIFLDFEYSGLDDIAKWVCDWICQPRHQKYSKELGDELMNKLGNSELGFDRYWRKRVEILTPIFYFKWCLIMLNKYLYGLISREDFNELLEYYKNVKQ